MIQDLMNKRNCDAPEVVIRATAKIMDSMKDDQMLKMLSRSWKDVTWYLMKKSEQYNQLSKEFISWNY